MIYNVFFTILLWSGRIYIWIFKKMKSIVVVYLLCLLYFMIKIHTYYSHQNMSEKLNFPLDVTFKNIFLFRKYEKCKMQKIIFKFYHCNFIRISKVVIIWLCNINYKRDLEVFGAFAKQFPEWFTKIKFKWLHLFRGSRRGWLRLLCCMPIYSP